MHHRPFVIRAIALLPHRRESLTTCDTGRGLAVLGDEPVDLGTEFGAAFEPGAKDGRQHAGHRALRWGPHEGAGKAFLCPGPGAYAIFKA